MKANVNDALNGNLLAELPFHALPRIGDYVRFPGGACYVVVGVEHGANDMNTAPYPTIYVDSAPDGFQPAVKTSVKVDKPQTKKIKATKTSRR